MLEVGLLIFHQRAVGLVAFFDCWSDNFVLFLFYLHYQMLGIAEMAELHPSVREKTDALDAAGNTTAAIGKGFAIGSAALVSLALFGAFVTRIRHSSGDLLFAQGVNLLSPTCFAFLIVGGMIPFAFAALTMKSVGTAAMEMVMEVQRQFDEKPHLLDENPTERPDYDACIAISTQASLKEMVPVRLIALFRPSFPVLASSSLTIFRSFLFCPFLLHPNTTTTSRAALSSSRLS
jgi:Na+/H+-translocating membrane pyrophosphatase